MSLPIAWIASFLFTVSTASAAPKGAVALIAGTLNSVAPNDYFSSTIIQTLEEQNFAVKAVMNLDPLGQFESNGSQALKELREWYHAQFPKADVPLTLIGHSAGGFYALYVAHQSRDLPIKNLIFFSTPLEGSRLAKRVLPEDLKFADRTGFFDFRGLPQITPENVKKFLSTIQLPEALRLFAVGGSQPFARGFDNRLNSKYLSVALSVTGKIIDIENDGIIERASAYGRPQILSERGKQMSITRLENLHINLEHPEQFLDYRFFLLGATMNVGFIEQEQRRVYSALGALIANAP